MSKDTKNVHYFIDRSLNIKKDILSIPDITFKSKILRDNILNANNSDMLRIGLDSTGNVIVSVDVVTVEFLKAKLRW